MLVPILKHVCWLCGFTCDCGLSEDCESCSDCYFDDPPEDEYKPDPKDYKAVILLC